MCQKLIMYSITPLVKTQQIILWSLPNNSLYHSLYHASLHYEETQLCVWQTVDNATHQRQRQQLKSMFEVSMQQFTLGSLLSKKSDLVKQSMRTRLFIALARRNKSHHYTVYDVKLITEQQQQRGIALRITTSMVLLPALGFCRLFLAPDNYCITLDLKWTAAI